METVGFIGVGAMGGAIAARMIQHGVPVLAIDPIPGGAKVRRQAGVLGWPHVFAADDLETPSQRARLAESAEAVVLRILCIPSGGGHRHNINFSREE